MDIPDLVKIRRFTLVIALILITLEVANVELKTPTEFKPLGIPMVINNPKLLTTGIALACIGSMLRFIYYGMLRQASPMRVRRRIINYKHKKFCKNHDDHTRMRMYLDRQIELFPRIGKITASVELAAYDRSIEKYSGRVVVPFAIRAVCLGEAFDFLLPVITSVMAIMLWFHGVFSKIPYP